MAAPFPPMLLYRFPAQFPRLIWAHPYGILLQPFSKTRYTSIVAAFHRSTTNRPSHWRDFATTSEESETKCCRGSNASCWTNETKVPWRFSRPWRLGRPERGIAWSYLDGSRPIHDPMGRTWRIFLHIPVECNATRSAKRLWHELWPIQQNHGLRSSAQHPVAWMMWRKCLMRLQMSSDLLAGKR